MNSIKNMKLELKNLKNIKNPEEYIVLWIKKLEHQLQKIGVRKND